MTPTLEPDWSAIAIDVPGVVVRSAARAGEGWTTVAYRVNDTLLFKFPKRASAWDELDREMVFLDAVRGRLPLPVPEGVCRVRESRGAAHGYVVYRCIPGEAVDPHSLCAHARPALAARLGEFLRALHDLDAREVVVPLPRDDAYETAVQYQRDAETHVAPRLTADERRVLRDVYARYLGDTLNFSEQPRVLHADLSAEHIFLSGDQITGIIDWGDVSLGDPDYDFMYLYEDLGESFVREMARHYGHPDADRLASKSYYYSIADQVSTIVYGGEAALPGDVDGSWHRLHALLAEDWTSG